jgi:hypothetical protein
MGFLIVSNPGADITGTITVTMSMPGVIITPITVTSPEQVTAKGGAGSSTSITFSGGLMHNQSVAIELEFTYPASVSLDGIRNTLVRLFTTP